MAKPGDDPRISKPTSSPREIDGYSFKYMEKARVAMEDWFIAPRYLAQLV
jgi:hypothetical protein